MKTIVGVLLSLLAVLTVSETVFAKGPTVRLIISGGDLAAPIQISDPTKLTAFNVWSGPGVSINGAADWSTSFADWKHRASPYLTQGLPRYEVSFYANRPDERPVYVVTYAYDPETARGFIQIPGGAHPNHGLNVRSILRGVEGSWFRASSACDSVLGYLIQQAVRP